MPNIAQPRRVFDPYNPATKRLLDPAEFNLVGSFLQANPWEAYLGKVPKEQPQQSHFLQRYNQIYNQWLAGETAKFKRGGASPGQGDQPEPFYNYMENYPWLQEFYGTPREQRGQGYPSRYTPPARWLMY